MEARCRCDITAAGRAILSPMRRRSPSRPRDGEGRFASTPQNKAAGHALRAARLGLGASQAAFAALLGQRLQIPLSPTTLSSWETGRRSVPSSVWIAAATAAGRSLDDLLQAADLPEAGGRPGPRPTELEDLRGEVTEVGRRCGALAEQVARLQEEVAETGATLALVVDALDRTGVLTGRGSRRRASRG